MTAARIIIRQLINGQSVNSNDGDKLSRGCMKAASKWSLPGNKRKFTECMDDEQEDDASNDVDNDDLKIVTMNENKKQRHQ